MMKPAAQLGACGPLALHLRPLLASAGLLVWGCVQTASADRLTRVGGEVVEDTVVAIDGGHITLSNATFALDEVWRIARTPAPAPVAADGVADRVVLRPGEIPARNVTVDAGTCRFDWDGGRGVTFSRGAVRALVFEAGAAIPVARQALARVLDKQAAADQVLALGQDNLPLPVAGAITAISSSAVTMNYQGRERTIARSRVCAVVFGGTGTTAQAASPLFWKATTADGAWVESRSARLADGVLTLDFGAGSLEIPWNRVCRLEYRSRRVRFVSDLDPSVATQDAVVTLPLPWQRNRKAMGGPLRFQGEPCDRGLGMHAPAAWTLELPESARRFLATIGLDEEYGRKGDCIVTVEVGGREVFRRRLRGGEAPLAVDVDVQQGGRLTLRAEPGENYDLGDHVNWYDARLIADQ